LLLSVTTTGHWVLVPPPDVAAPPVRESTMSTDTYGVLFSNLSARNSPAGVAPSIITCCALSFCKVLSAQELVLIVMVVRRLLVLVLLAHACMPAAPQTANATRRILSPHAPPAEAAHMAHLSVRVEFGC
jgi:hypothetical protein